MRLQEVLKEREAEISMLEGSLKENGKDETVVPSPITKEIELVKTNGDVGPLAHLSPETLNQFDTIRETMVNGHVHDNLENGSEKTGSVSETDESLDRLNELML